MSKAPTKRRWLLIGSLALNLFLIGFLAVGAMKIGKHEHRWNDPFRMMLSYMRDRGPEERFLHRLSEEDRLVMVSLKETNGPAFKDVWSESRAARDAVRQLMRDGIRDPDAISQAMTVARERRAEAFIQVEILLKAAAEELSDDGYKMLAGKPRPPERP